MGGNGTSSEPGDAYFFVNRSHKCRSPILYLHFHVPCSSPCFVATRICGGLYSGCHERVPCRQLQNENLKLQVPISTDSKPRGAAFACERLRWVHARMRVSRQPARILCQFKLDFEPIGKIIIWLEIRGVDGPKMALSLRP